MKTPPPSRRQFLRQSAVTGLVLPAALGGALPVRGARAADPAPPRLRIGCIGVGERAGALLGELLPLVASHNLRIVAVCDVWRRNLDAAVERIRAAQDTTPRAFTRYAELLALEDLDAVVIATPDFSHGTLLNAALEAGKDVYIEKPMTIDLPSANRALDTARARQRVVQVGTQRRSDGLFRAAARRVASGVLGPINRVTAEMNFNQARWLRPLDDCHAADVDWPAFLLHLPPRDFDAGLLRRWQLRRETSNGFPGLWMTHYADAVHLLTGARYPTAAVALGGNYVWKDGREHTDTFHALLEYPEGFLFSWGMGLGNAAGVRFTIHGTRATLDVEKWGITPEPGPGSAPAMAEPPKPEPIPREPGMGHVENWVQCLRSRARPNADIEFGHQHVVATVLSALALQTGRRQRYDPVARTIVEG